MVDHYSPQFKSPLIKALYDAREEMNQWIKDNKPSDSTSKKLFEAFLEKHRNNITGDDIFVEKIVKVISKASKLSSGSVILQRLLDSNVPVFYNQEKSNSLSLESMKVGFCFLKAATLTLNQGGERMMVMGDSAMKTITFIHENLHLWHFFVKTDESYQKIQDPPFLYDMHDQEEELTITGNLHLNDIENRDFCCENTARLELGIPLVHTHLGIPLNDDGSPVLESLIKGRVLGDLKKIIESQQLLLSKDLKINPEALLELTLRSWRVETDVSMETENEWKEIIRLIIQLGGKSELALKIAVLGNSADIASMLLRSGTQVTSKIFCLAVDCMRYDNHRRSAMIEILQTHNTFDSDLPMIAVKPSDEKFEKIAKVKSRRNNDFLEKKFSGKLSLEVFTLLIEFYNCEKGYLAESIVSLHNEELLPLLIKFNLPINYAFRAMLSDYNPFIEGLDFIVKLGYEPSTEDLEELVARGNVKLVNLMIEKWKHLITQEHLIVAMEIGSQENTLSIINAGVCPTAEIKDWADNPNRPEIYQVCEKLIRSIELCDTSLTTK